MKRKITTTILIAAAMLLITINSFSQVTNWAWAKSAKGNDEDVANSITTDPSGNVYVAGSFSSVMIIFGNDTLHNANGGQPDDLFLVKYDPNGNVLWAKSAGGVDEDVATCVTTDAAGNVYLTGYFQSLSIVFGSDTLFNTGISYRNIFLVKYDPSGNVIWAKTAAGSDNDYSYSVCTDGSGNAYICGSFRSPTLTIGSTVLTNAGFNEDLFFAKYDASGNVLWAKSAGGSDYDAASAIHADASGKVYITGYYGSSSITFGSTTLTNVSATHYDIFLAKYDGSGNAIWAKTAGGSSNDMPNSISTDDSANVIIVGESSSTSLTFGTIVLTNGGSGDVFVAKYDSSGNVHWAKRAGGNARSYATSVVTDVVGNIYVAGNFQSDSIRFGSTNLITNGMKDMFQVKYDRNGNALWAISEGGTLYDYASSITTNAGGNIYFTGNFISPTISFGTTTLTLTSTGWGDFFIAKINSVTGIEELAQNYNGILVYPNPTSSILNIHQSTSSPNQLLIITDIMGNEVYQETLIGIDNSISISNWSNGIYFYEVRGKEGSARGKFIVQK